MAEYELTEDEETRAIIATLRSYIRITHRGFLVYADMLRDRYPRIGNFIDEIRVQADLMSITLDLIEKGLKDNDV